MPKNAEFAWSKKYKYIISNYGIKNISGYTIIYTANYFTMETTKKFHCIDCDFKTEKQSNWLVHLATKKHINIINKKGVLKSIILENNVKSVKYLCICGTSYRHMTSLYKHRKNCDEYKNKSQLDESMHNNSKSENDSNSEDEKAEDQKLDAAISKQLTLQNPPVTSDLIMEFMQQSKDMQNLLMEQNRELQNTIVELSKKQAVTNIQNNNITNNNFNLNLFLNEQCKDAISITDFIKSIKLTVSDLEATGRLGYVPGISRIFINKLKELDIYTRPLHCTDLKRETVYIKDQDNWEKESPEKTGFRNIVKRIAKKNLQQLPAWQAQNPDFVKLDTPENNEFLKISLSSLGSYCPEDEEKDMNKIMRNVLKEIVIDK